MLFVGRCYLLHSSIYFHKNIRIGDEKKNWIKPQRNTDNLENDPRSNGKITIKKEMINCMFYLLLIETYLIISEIFYPASTVTRYCNKMYFLPHQNRNQSKYLVLSEVYYVAMQAEIPIYKIDLLSNVH